MKLLTVAVPCYNSQDYLERCLDSLVTGGKDVEILVINDGSTDSTAQIAERYQKEYCGIVRAIHKDNAGHGSAVNRALSEADGIFFKVVDSDDWVLESAYQSVLSTLRQFVGGDSVLDMLISNFVYEKAEAKKRKVMMYRHVLPQETIFTWKDIGHFHVGQYLLMHSVIFRTKLLKECGLKLPENTFYVDNLFVFEPLPYVRYMYYLDVNFYRYFIGREDQSVNEKVMISRIDQQIYVNKRMVGSMVSAKFSHRKQKQYMESYLEIITTVSSIMLIRSGLEEHLQAKKELWDYIRQHDKLLYRRLRYGMLGNSVHLPGKGGRRISVNGYRICRRFFQFN